MAAQHRPPMPDPMTTTSASFGIGERDEDDDEDADDGVAGDSDAEEADAQGVVCVRWRRTRGEMTVDAARGRGWQVIIGPHIALAVMSPSGPERVRAKLESCAKT